MKFNANRFLSAFGSSAGIMAPILLVTALGSAYFAATSVKTASASLAMKAHNVGDHASLSLERTQITEQEAAASARRLQRLSPAVFVDVKGKSVVVAAHDPQLFAEFMHALTTIQSTAADIVWEAEDICLSACAEGGDSARAKLTGYKQSIKSSV